MQALERVDRWLAAALHLPLAHRHRVGALQRLSHAGDHAAVWLTATAVGAALDERQRAQWARAGVAVAAAHASASVAKRVVTRDRPPRPAWVTSASTPSPRSFPSSHAASSAAAAVALSGLVPTAVRVPLAAGIGWSRLALGLHWPSDVAAGALLGAVVARALR